MTDAEYIALPARWSTPSPRNPISVLEAEPPEGYDYGEDGAYGVRRAFIWEWNRLINLKSAFKPIKTSGKEIMKRAVDAMMEDR